MAARMEEQVLVFLPSDPGRTEAGSSGLEAGPSGPEEKGGGVEVARATEGRSLAFWVAPVTSGISTGAPRILY